MLDMSVIQQHRGLLDPVDSGADDDDLLSSLQRYRACRTKAELSCAFFAEAIESSILRATDYACVEGLDRLRNDGWAR